MGVEVGEGWGGVVGDGGGEGEVEGDGGVEVGEGDDEDRGGGVVKGVVVRLGVGVE